MKDPDTKDYNKLKKVMQYLRNTKTLTLAIEPNDKPKWWVDGIFCTSRHEKSYGHIHDTRKRSHIHSVMKAETKYKDIHGS